MSTLGFRFFNQNIRWRLIFPTSAQFTQRTHSIQGYSIRIATSCYVCLALIVTVFVQPSQGMTVAIR